MRFQPSPLKTRPSYSRPHNVFPICGPDHPSVLPSPAGRGGVGWGASTGCEVGSSGALFHSQLPFPDCAVLGMVECRDMEETELLENSMGRVARGQRLRRH